MKPGFEEQENPFIGIFPTKDQHREVITQFIKKFENDANPDTLILARNYLRSKSRKYEQVNDIIANIKSDDIEQYLYIRELYNKYNFKENKIWHAYFEWYENPKVFSNFKTFKSIVPYSNIEVTSGIFNTAAMYIHSEDNQKINKHLDTQGISTYKLENNKLEKNIDLLLEYIIKGVIRDGVPLNY